MRAATPIAGLGRRFFVVPAGALPMKTNIRAFFPLLVLVPLCAGSNRLGDRPSYQPKTGTTLSKTISVESELQLEDMKMEMNGQDMSDVAGQVEIAMKVTMKLGVSDRYEAVADGRPSKLTRTFDEIASNTHISQSNPATGEEEKDIPLTSALEGQTVVFSWDGDEGEYRVGFENDADGDETLLENLKEDIDLRDFLPTKEVSEGDSWKVPAEAVKAALAPGGDIKLRPDGDVDPMGGMDQFSQNDMVGDLDGKFDAVYGGTREEDGTRVAVVKLTIDAKSAQDMTSRLDDIKEQMKGNLPEGLELDVSAMDGEYEVQAEGELLWNLQTGVFHSLHLSGEMRMIVDMSMSMKMGENEQSMDISQTFAGTQTISWTAGE